MRLHCDSRVHPGLERPREMHLRRIQLGFLFTVAWALAVMTGEGAVHAEWQQVPGTLATRYAKTVSPANVHPEYPRPQLVRNQWQNLNGLWDYAITGLDSTVPSNYTGRILVPFPIESALSGVSVRLRETNTLWYRRTFQIPVDWIGKRIRLHFGAVDWHARIYVNGRAAGEHKGGYDPFSLDITMLLKLSGDEEVVVAVQDPTEGEQPRGKQSRNPEGIFYTPSSGIWQTVWLEPVPRARIDGLQLTPDTSLKSLHVRVAVNRLAEMFRVEAVAYQEGKPVARVIGPVNDELELHLEKPRLWSPTDPFLYDLKVTLFQEDALQDEVTSYFGLRNLSIRKDEEGIPRMVLNGEKVFQMGVLDQGFWPDGLYTPPCDAALQEELALVKELGFNTVRKHVKVEPARWYYWCDRMGLLVWQDMPSGNNLTASARRQFEVELQQIMHTLHNHPSIVIWVLFNEGWGQYDTARLTTWVKQTDPSRLVNSASGWIDKQTGDILDFHTYPGPEAPGVESLRVAVLGEFGGVGLTLSNHAWASKTWGYERVETIPQFNSRYTDLLKRVWNLDGAAGLNAAIYTQLTDVETECNGLITYDREVVKLDVEQARAANLGRLREAPLTALLPAGAYGTASWRYTLEEPGARWAGRSFDSTKWSQGRAPFGIVPAPAGQETAHTLWQSGQIWMRRFFILPAGLQAPLSLRICHTASAEVYLNGLPAAAVSGKSEGYVSVPLLTESLTGLREGLNVLAVHARATEPSPFIDIGIYAPATAAKRE